jgi:hypothetical protein
MTRASDGVSDATIPHLGRLTHAPEATRLVGAALRGQAYPWMARGEGPLDVRAVTVVRGHPGSRWTLRYAVRQGDEDRILIAKVYARDRGDVAATLAALRCGGFGRGQRLQVAAPLAYVPALHLLLEEEAPGQPARAALRGGLPEVGERTARWLAAFHTAALPLPAVYRLRDPLLKARHWTRTLRTHAPALADDGRRLLAALMEARPAWPPRPHLVHGDFNASHVYLAAETTTVIDWDAWGVGDGAEDAGRFLASLHHLAVRDPVQREAVTQAVAAFARTYQATVPLDGRSLAFYDALACLQKAARLAADGRPRHRHHAETLLTAGAQALAVGHMAPSGIIGHV